MASTRMRSVSALAAIVLACLAGSGTQATDLMEQYTLAQESDPTFQAARLEREIADQRLKESWSGMLPQISANAEANRTYQNIKSSDNFLFTPGKTDYYGRKLYLSVTQPVYRADVLERIPQARTEVRQAEFILQVRLHDLMMRVSETYFGFLAAGDDLEFAVSEREAIARQLEEAEERVGAGLAPVIDVHDARARFALSRASEIEADNRLEEAREALAEITGRTSSEVAVLGESFPLAPPDLLDVEAWVRAAEFQNPGIQALEAAVDIAEREVRRRKRTRLPTLDFVASYNASDTGGSMFTTGGDGSNIATGDVALRLGIPIYDGGRTAARAKTANLERRITRHELERERRRVERETRASYQGVVSAITRVEALQQSVFSHEAALALKEEGMRSGLNTGIEVLDARRDLFSARRDLALARYEYLLNGLKLKRSSGTLSDGDLEQVNAYLQP